MAEVMEGRGPLTVRTDPDGRVVLRLQLGEDNFAEGLMSPQQAVEFAGKLIRAAGQGSGPSLLWSVDHGGYVRRYVGPRGRVAHAVEDSDDMTGADSACGAYPDDALHWHGTGSQVERDIAADLPKCKRCVAVLATRVG